MSKKIENRSDKREIPDELKEFEQNLTNANPKVFEGIPNKKKQEILQSLVTISFQEKMHSSPLPDSEALVEYNQVIPNGADRIMIMAEKQQTHRMSMKIE